jgi:hypothetical protein
MNCIIETPVTPAQRRCLGRLLAPAGQLADSQTSLRRPRHPEGVREMPTLFLFSAPGWVKRLFIKV